MESLPFVRCVGIGTGVYQAVTKKAYDWRLICVLEGKGALELEGQTLETMPGQLFLIPPGTAYRACSPSNQRIAVVNFDTDGTFAHIAEPVLSVDAAAFEEDKLLATPPIACLRETVYTLPAAEIPHLEELYGLYLRQDPDPGRKRFVLGARFAYILTKVLDPVKKPGRLAARVYAYTVEHACEKLTVETVARQFNYSSSYVEKLLHREYDTGFRQLILDTRLKKALWLLENTSDSCEQIAISLGFCSSQHFSNAFFKKYGRTPRQCR